MQQIPLDHTGRGAAARILLNYSHDFPNNHIRRSSGQQDQRFPLHKCISFDQADIK
jgi:hypothetical protein